LDDAIKTVLKKLISLFLVGLDRTPTPFVVIVGIWIEFDWCLVSKLDELKQHFLVTDVCKILLDLVGFKEI
jgi:hypothetical protein